MSESPTEDPSPQSDDELDSDRAEAAPADRDLILDLNFVPDWARKPAEESAFIVREQKPQRRGKGSAPRDNRRNGAPRPPRGNGDGRRPGAPSAKRPSGPRPGNDRSGPDRSGPGRPAQDRSGPGRPGPGQSGPGQSGPGRSASGHSGPGRPASGRSNAPQQRHGRPQRPSGPPRPPVTIRFVPDDHHLAVILKKMRAGRRAYPLHNITGLFLKHPETCRALIQIESKDADHKLTQCAACGVIAFDPKTMQTHLLNKHIGDMFAEETIEAEPPKGNFVCIRRCGLSNELLGPPNHNSTEERIRELHATRFSDMSIDRYRERIQTLHDEALIEKWKDQWRQQKVYRLTSDIEDAARAAAVKEAPSAETTPKAETTPEPEAPAADASATEEMPESDVSDNAGPEASPDPELATEETPAAEAETVSPEDAQAAEPPAAAEVDLSDIKTYTWAEASEMFLKKYESRMTRKTFRATLPAGMAGDMDDPWLRDSAADAWRRECRSPRSLAFAIRGAFKHRKMHIFKAGKQMEFVTATPPVPLAPERAVESIGEVLRYLQENPGSTRQTLVEGLRPGAVQDKALADEILGPLGWMVERGHIIEFFDGTLSVPRPPSPRQRQKRTPEAKAKKAANKAAAAPAPEPPQAETPEKTPAEPAEAPQAKAPEKTPAEPAEAPQAETPEEKPAEPAEPPQAEA